MKITRLFATLMLAMTFGFHANAEDETQTSALIVADDTPITPESNTKEVKKFDSDWLFHLEYLGLKDNTGVGVSVGYKMFVCGLEGYWGETPCEKSDPDTFNNTTYIYMKNITANWQWNIFLGWQDRYFIFKDLFIEGRIAVKWQNYMNKWSDIVMENNKEKVEEKSYYDDWFGLVVSPRIGLRVDKTIAITAGYRWDFEKFKFKKENRSDLFTVGIDVVF